MAEEGGKEMKVKVPKEIQIGCHSYKVFLKDKSTSDFDGDTYHLKEVIRVREDLPPTARGTTFLHEALHVIDQVYSFGMNEHNLDLLAEGLGQLLYADLGIELDWSDIQTMTAVAKPE